MMENITHELIINFDKSKHTIDDVFNKKDELLKSNNIQDAYYKYNIVDNIIVDKITDFRLILILEIKEEVI